MRTAPKPTTAKDRILETADDLFYRQGYQATGINQIIKESGVAKASFYANFPSKDDLGVQYVRERASRELAEIREGVERRKAPGERFLAILQDWEPWLKETEFRGCAFANMTAEVTSSSAPIRAQVRRHDDEFRTIIRKVTEQLISSDPKYRRLDVDQVAESYYLIARGAIVASQLYRDLWPLRRALKAAEQLIRT